MTIIANTTRTLFFRYLHRSQKLQVQFINEGRQIDSLGRGSGRRGGKQWNDEKETLRYAQNDTEIPDQVGNDVALLLGMLELIIFALCEMVVESAGNETRSKVSPLFWRRLPSQDIFRIRKDYSVPHQGHYAIFNYKQLNASGLWRRR